jgi:hypothetical protein
MANSLDIFFTVLLICGSVGYCLKKFVVAMVQIYPSIKNKENNASQRGACEKCSGCHSCSESLR